MEIINNKEKYSKIISDDFETMKGMLDVIQERIKNVPPIKQMEFLKPLKYFIMEAWTDATNPEDSFLYQNEKMNHSNLKQNT